MLRVLTGLLFVVCLTAQAEDQALLGRLKTISDVHHGKVAFYGENVKTGQTVSLNADTPVQTASVIKLTVLYEALEQIRAGKVHFEDRISVEHSDQVSGSGILTFFDTPQELTFKDVLTFMIIMSDNTATNLAIDHLGLKNIDDRIVALGLKDTWLYKKVMKSADGPMPADQKQFGLGKTTAREMASVMKRFVSCELDNAGTKNQPSAADQKLCDAAMFMLRNQFYRDSIPRYLEEADSTESLSRIANKTGALNAVRNDVGVVFTAQGPMILSGFTYENQDQSWTVDNEAEVLLAKLAKEVVQSWSGVTK
jgi:beta-lactamase class A